MFLRSLALVALILVSSAALARPPMSTNQLVDDVGTPIGTPSNPLYTSGGGSSGGSVTPGGTSGTQAEAVQGIPGGVPQNSFPGQYNASLPTFANGQSGYMSLDASGRVIVAPNITIGSSTNTIGNVVTAASGGAVSPSPIVAANSFVAKASAGNLYGYSVTAGGTAMFLAILNGTTLPAAGATINPWECIPVAPNTYVARRQELPDRYTAGIVAVTTSSCSTFTAVAPQVVSLIVQ